jgi:hypothetical protein
MIVHTLIYSFSADMTDGHREEFFAQVSDIMVEQGHADRVEHRPHLPLPADEHAPVFVAGSVLQVVFPDLDALAATSALPAMRDFIGSWQARYPYKVVWANHEPF